MALVAAACGGASTASTIEPFDDGGGSVAATTIGGEASPAEQPQAEGTGGDAAPSETPAEATRTRPDGPDAPDFVLTLGQGGEFSLSAEKKPVYIVFWADW